MSNRYEIDHAWLSADEARDHGDSATVRLSVTGTNPRDVVMEWLEDVPADALGVRGRNGWIVQEVSAEADQVVVDITAGGERIVEAMSAGTTEAYEVLTALGCELSWEQLPRE